MQLFKLLALAPLAGSLVAAAAVPRSGELMTRDDTTTLEVGKTSNDPTLDDSKTTTPFGVPTNGHHGHKGLGPDHKHHGKGYTKKIKQISARIVAGIDFEQTVSIYHDLVNATSTVLAEVRYDMELDFTDNFGTETDVFIDLNEVFEVTVDAHKHLVQYGHIQEGEIQITTLVPGSVNQLQSVFAGLDSVLKIVLNHKGDIGATYTVQIRTFIGLLTSYLKINKETVAGVLAEIEGTVSAVSDKLDKCKDKGTDSKTPSGTTAQMLLAV